MAVRFMVPMTSPTPSSAAQSLAFQDSCGSRGSPSGEWWPVVASSSRELLASVRSRYCGDAYINASGWLQAASFSEAEAAQDFAERLAEATGERFWIADPLRP
ncbi:hypothetical protein KQ304_06945 [Synechococcus sp. CS-1329]|nr:hypothetical protein [Synechococcus sp. CS-1329]